MKYKKRKPPLVILAGHEYGTGSSRDWAAKGTRLLGVKAVSRRVSSGFIDRTSLEWACCHCSSLREPILNRLDSTARKRFSITGLSDKIQPGQEVTLEIESNAGQKKSVPVKLRIDTPIEIDYYKHGGILPFVLRQLLAR